MNLIPALERISDKFVRRRLFYPNEDKQWDIRALLEEEYHSVFSGVSFFVLTKVYFDFFLL